MNDELFSKNLVEKIEKLRNSRAKDNLLPNLKDRMDAAYLIDKVEGDKPIKLPTTNTVKKSNRKIQKSDKVCIIGSDVVSLFPTLKNIETGRLARHAI